MNRIKGVKYLVLPLLTCQIMPALADESKTDSQVPLKTATISVGTRAISISALFAERLQKLRQKGVTVVYPTFVPSGFSLSSVKISDADEEGKLHPDYALQFCNKKHVCFSIESAYTGIGDGPDGDKTLKGKSKEFGPFSVYVFKPRSEGNNTDSVYYLGSWMSDKQRVLSEKRHDKISAGRYHHFYGNGITDKEAVAIVESLTPIK